MSTRHREPPRFFATAAKGTEPLLRDELFELGLPRVRADRGGVHFGAERADAYRACMWSRIALRILEPIAEFDCPDEDALYDGVQSFDFGRVLDTRRTLAVRAAARSSRLTHTQYIAQRSKDAVVDQLRARYGGRPSVDRASPDVQLFLHLLRDRATLYLDYAGDSLHEHGYRKETGAAPLKETLAAALVRFSGWDGNSPLCDPMCGSGTLLLEAGSWAARRAPGLGRERFGFERWADFDDDAARATEQLREEARSVAQPLTVPLYGSDADPAVLALARENAERAGLALRLEQRPVSQVVPKSEQGVLVTNPPYGERLERATDSEQQLASLLQRFEAHERALIVPRAWPTLERTERYLLVFNGAIECELRAYRARGPAPDVRARNSRG